MYKCRIGHNFEIFVIIVLAVVNSISKDLYKNNMNISITVKKY